MIEIKNEKYFTAKEVAEMFSVTIGTIAKWRQKGKLKSFARNKRKHLFSEKSIELSIIGEKHEKDGNIQNN